MRYSDHEQRLMDQRSGEGMDHRAAMRASLQQSLAAFWDDLSRFDWDYEYSDDHGVWTRANDERQRLAKRADHSTAHRELYDAFAAWHRDSERAKPARPVTA